MIARFSNTNSVNPVVYMTSMNISDSPSIHSRYDHVIFFGQ